MSRIDELLDKTVRKDGEAKKWIVVVGISLGLAIALTGYLGIFVFSEPVLDNYLTNVSSHPKATLYAYGIYDDSSTDYSDSIFFMGSSLVRAGIKTDKIAQYLNDNDINLYNLYMPMDTPLMRSMEIQKIIDTNPKMVIFGITYRDVVDAVWYEERTALVYDSLDVRDDALYLYNSNELQDIQTPPKYDYKKTYLLSAWKNALQSPAPIDSSTVPQEPTVPSIEEIEKEANNPRNNDWHPTITDEPTRYKEALLYNVNTLQEAGIDVVIINMPLSPALSKLISEDTRLNYFNLLNSTGADWYDTEMYYSYECFTDLVHMSSIGSDQFAPVVADIISKEVA